jgi:hypothetical protein
MLAALVAAALVAAPPARSSPGADTGADRGPEAPYGMVVFAAKQRQYQLTAEDAVWAARMLVGEAGGRDDPDGAGVLWSMLNSYMIRPVQKHYPTFRAFIRAYCTPLQPYLKSKGAIHRHRKRGTPMVEVEPGKWQLERHVKIQERPWAELPKGARDLVLRVFTGQLQSVCGNATQFCSTRIYFRDRHDRNPTDDEHVAFTRTFAEGKTWRWVEVPGANAMKNCFFEELRFGELDRPAVRILPPRRSGR